MAAIRSAREIAEKWASVTPTRTAFYEDGIKSPKKDWAKAALSSEPVYKEAVTKAAQEGRYGRGVTAAGTDKWQRKSLEVGAGRWGPGVSVAAPDFESGYAPFRDAIEKVTLKPRFPKGDPRNYDRVRQIGEALHSLKISR